MNEEKAKSDDSCTQNTDSNKTIPKDCDKYLQILYESLVKEIREIERNYISFLIPFISALGIYYLGLEKYLCEPCPSCHTEEFFTITTIIALFILIVIYFSANIFAYTHRSNQIVLSNIEQSCCFYEKILPPNWNLKEKNDNCETIDPPEIYKFIKLTAVMAGILMIVIYLLITRSTDFVMGWYGLFFLVILIVYICFFRWKFFIGFIENNCKGYHKKLKELYKQTEKSETKSSDC